MIKENYEYINLQSLKESTFDDMDIQKEIMELFIDLIDEYLETLNKELPNKNWHELFKATHKIKPNVNMFGIESLEPIILKLDSNLRNEENLETIDGLAEKCITIFKQVRIEILTELNSMKND